MYQQPSVEVAAMVTGQVTIAADYVYRHEGNSLIRTGRLLRNSLLPGGDVLRAPCLAYVIRHPVAGELLIDTGFHPDARHDRRKDFGTMMSLVFSSLRVAEEPYEEQLRRLGVDPGEVERVIMTHLHVDHTSGMRLLPRARFVIAREEWEAATRDGMSRKGFIAHHYPPKSRVELVDFRVGEAHGPFERTIDLLGDGSVRLISTAGHSPGHVSVLLRVTGGRQVLVVGDAAYTRRNISEQRLPLLTADDDCSARTLAQLKAFTEQEPDARLVPSHDPEAWKQLEPAPR